MISDERRVLGMNCCINELNNYCLIKKELISAAHSIKVHLIYFVSPSAANTKILQEYELKSTMKANDIAGFTIDFYYIVSCHLLLEEGVPGKMTRLYKDRVVPHMLCNPGLRGPACCCKSANL